MSERIPPYSDECERGVIGASLLDFGEHTLELCDRYEITEAAFYVPANRTVFKSLLDLHASGHSVDVLTLINYMREAGTLEQVGGVVAINRFIDDTPTSKHVEYYINEVKKREKLRDIVDIARDADIQCYDGNSDPDKILEWFEGRIGGVSSAGTAREKSWAEAVGIASEEMERIMSSGRGVDGISTGFADLDRATSGLTPGELVLLAARPSQGKTSLAMNIAENVATGRGDADGQSHPVAIFSLEMSQDALAKRMMCSYAGVSWYKIVRGFVQRESAQNLVAAAAYAAKLPIHCDDGGGLDVQQVRIRAKRMQKKHGIGLIIIDYLQLLNAEARARHGRQIETMYISGQLKAMAKELNLPVLALSQLSRIKDDRLEIPRLHMLRDSGALEQDADKVLFLRRPCMYENDDAFEDKTRADVTIAKNRNGPVGRITMNFDDNLTRFSDRARATDYED